MYKILKNKIEYVFCCYMLSRMPAETAYPFHTLPTIPAKFYL